MKTLKILFTLPFLFIFSLLSTAQTDAGIDIVAWEFTQQLVNYKYKKDIFIHPETGTTLGFFYTIDYPHDIFEVVMEDPSYTSSPAINIINYHHADLELKYNIVDITIEFSMGRIHRITLTTLDYYYTYCAYEVVRFDKNSGKQISLFREERLPGGGGVLGSEIEVTSAEFIEKLNEGFSFLQNVR